jgi:4-hydroxymandelate oxidase
MDLKTIRQQAKDQLKGICRVCRECNGVACAGEIPGMGGVGTGASFKNNVLALAAFRLNLRTLHEAKNPLHSFNLFGQTLQTPILGAPVTATALNTQGAVDDEKWADDVVKGCLDAGTIAMTGDGPEPVNFQSGIDAITRAGGLGIPIIKPREQENVIQYIRRAEAAGALAVGMDIDGAGLIPMKMKGQPVSPKSKKELSEIISSTSLPFIVKGIMTPDEAEVAAEAGAAAIVVSNHGGRALDHTPGTAEVLPEIAAKLKGRLLVLADGGIRSGVDVLKMLALGADAVLVGRPLFTAAAGGGQEGIALTLTQMTKELHQAMILTGCSSLEEITMHILA